MPKEFRADPPSIVKWIGWTFLIVSAVLLFRSLLDLLLWKVLQPAAPRIFADAETDAPQLRFLRPLFAHYTTVKIVEVIAWSAVAFMAVQFLRLRPWARIALQVVGWLSLAYVASFGVLWSEVWLHMAGPQILSGSPVPDSHRTIGLIAGLCVCLLFAGALAALLVLLRSLRVREFFVAPSGGR